MSLRDVVDPTCQRQTLIIAPVTAPFLITIVTDDVTLSCQTQSSRCNRTQHSLYIGVAVLVEILLNAHLFCQYNVLIEKHLANSIPLAKSDHVTGEII